MTGWTHHDEARRQALGETFISLHPLPVGAPVTYHGTLREHHGPGWTVVQPVTLCLHGVDSHSRGRQLACGNEWEGYVIRSAAGVELQCRWSSIAPIRPETLQPPGHADGSRPTTGSTTTYHPPTVSGAHRAAQGLNSQEAVDA